MNDGWIAYTPTSRAWVAAAEPLAPQAMRARALKIFAERAARVRKVAVSLPVSRETAKLAVSVGYGALKIGTEPKFDLVRMKPSADRLPSARQMVNRGAVADEFRPESLLPEERQELDELAAEWMARRKTVALGFLNVVDPWALSADKRYFRVRLRDETLAFLAAVPIPATQGWYLIDILRREASPVGTVELLVLEAMRILKEGGAREVSLGVAPLSGLERWPRVGRQRPYVYRALRLIFERGGAFYNFRTLHQFKLKFSPTKVEDAYLVYYPPRLGLSVALGLLQAFFPNGFLHALVGSTYRLYFRFRLGRWLDRVQGRVLVFRGPASSPSLAFRRIRWTLLLAVLINAIYFLGPTGWIDRFSFGAGGISLGRLALSPFLHWNAAHVVLNTLTLLFFCGTVEYLAGATAMLACFAAGAAFSNPLTVAILREIGGVAPRLWSAAAAETDVGASLGIFACAGAFSQLFRRGPWWLVGLVPLVVAYCFAVGSALSLNHLSALAIGVVAFRLWLNL